MTGWTTPADVTARLRRRWDRGDYLTAAARGDRFETVEVPISGPRAGELGERFDEVRDWVTTWHRAARSPHIEVLTRTVGGRKFGVNELPARVRVTSLAALTGFLGTSDERRRHTRMLAQASGYPLLWEWVAAKPGRALRHGDEFGDLVTALTWIAANAGSGRQLREVDAPGIDTKFIESHRTVLLELGPLVVAPDLIDTTEKSIAGRFGFATGVARIRLRFLDPDVASPLPGFDDVEVRVADLARMPLDVDSVVIVENLATYLSFPASPRAVLVFGGGYAAAAVGGLGWLRDKRVYYWGDLDTHGFAILDRVRVTAPHTRSFLMDRPTLLAHRTQWGTESSPVDRPLRHLTEAESALYRELVEDVHGRGVRLEQERIRLPVNLAEVVADDTA